MEDGLLSLKWNNHKSTFFHILSNLRKRESYTDATIACEGRFFPVHKLVMSTCSDYFCDIFQRTTCKAPVVILKDIRYQEVESLLDYMYLGEVDVKQSELAGLIKAAECLRIKGLAVPDEEPNSSSKRPNYLSENKLSPSAKRHRRDSDSSDDPHYYGSQYNKGQSHSPIHHSATSSRSHSTSSTPVTSQTADTEAMPQSMPPPSYSESRRSTANSHPLSSGEQFGHEDKDSAPLEFIKVELDDDKGDKCKEKSKSIIQTNLKDDSRGEGGGRLEGSMQEKQHGLQNNYSEYCNSESDIDKEEPEQLETFNGSEIPGPSGVQGASQLMTWGEEEGSFPHNLFGTEDASHQQVCIATMDPELVAVRMFQGSKTHVQQIGLHQLQRLQQDETLIQLSQQPGPTKVFLLQEQLPQSQSVEVVQKPPRSTSFKRPLSRQQKRRQPQQHFQIIHSEELIEENRSLSEANLPSGQLHPISHHTDTTSMQPIQVFNSHFTKADKKVISLLNTVDLRRIEEPPKLLQLQSLEEHSLTVSHEKALPVNSIEKHPSDKSLPHGEGTQSSSTSSLGTSPQDLSSRSFRLHECPYCSYSSRSKVDLNKHIRTHTKEKPYKCHLCKYESGDRSNYRRHMAGVHKINDSDLPAELQPRRVSKQEMMELATEEQTSNSLSLSAQVIETGVHKASNSEMSSMMHAQQPTKEQLIEEQIAADPLAMSVQTIEVIAIPFTQEQCQPTVTSPNT